MQNNVNLLIVVYIMLIKIICFKESSFPMAYLIFKREIISRFQFTSLSFQFLCSEISMRLLSLTK